MADITVSATGNYIIGIDDDADGGNHLFVIGHDYTTNDAYRLLIVDETGIVTFGPIGGGGAGGATPRVERDGTVVFTNTNTSSTDVALFRSGGTVKASIRSNGLGVFDQGGILVFIKPSDPDGSQTADEGTLMAAHVGSEWSFKLCLGSTSWKKHVVT